MDQKDSNPPQNSQQEEPASHQTNDANNRNGGNNHEELNNYETTDGEIDSGEYYQLFLRRLLGLVSRGQPEAVASLIGTIRAGASQEEIFATLSQLVASSGLEETATRA